MAVIILKIGGSVIAPKAAKRPFLRRQLLESIGAELGKTFPHRTDSLIIIHGGGSFCHPIAKAFDLAKGTRGNEKKRHAALETRAICKGLHENVARILSKHLPIASIDTSSIARNTDGILNDIDLRPIRDALKDGLIPILSGHVVADETFELSLASGDRIAAMLGEKLGAESVFFASDVDGVFDRDPHADREARRLPKLSFRELKRQGALSGAAHTDATGGMKEKFDAFFAEKNPTIRNVIVFDGENTRAFSMLTDPSFPFGTTVTN